MPVRQPEVPTPHPHGTPSNGSDAWARVIALARDQAGSVAVRQALACGVSRSAFDARIRREAWHRPYRGVVLLPGAVPDGPALAAAAVLAVGPTAALSGSSALALHGITDSWPDPVEVVLPAPVHRSAPAGVRVRRTRTLLHEDLQRRNGTPVTVVPRAFLDAAATLSGNELRTLLIDARQRRRTTVARVMDRAARAPSVPGRGRLLRACREVDGSGADSELVRCVEQWLRSQGIALDRQPRTVDTGTRRLHPDLTVQGRDVGIEVDGFGFHASRHALELDQRKHNAYQVVGWTVLRLGWDRFHRDPEGFLTELRAAIRTHIDP